MFFEVVPERTDRSESSSFVSFSLALLPSFSHTLEFIVICILLLGL